MRRINRKSAEMPFLDHLEELRWRIIWSVLAVVASVALGFYVVLHYDIIALLERPILPYFGLLFSTVLSFGLAFELPVVVLLLSAAGLVTPQHLSRFRRHAVVLIVVAAALLTPGDYVWGTLALAVPLYLLYESSVLVARFVWRRRSETDDSVVILLAPLLLWGNRRSLRAA